MRIEKKTWPDYFNEILAGRKNFDLRLADFAVSPGDILVLREWDPAKKDYTGRQIEKEVTYVLYTKDVKFWPKTDVDKHGYTILSIK
jgi:hypothetical protein